MSLSLVVLRPEPGLSETLASARAHGLTAIGAPLFQIEPVAWEVPDPRRFEGLLAGSANVFRHAGEDLHALLGLRVYAVGARTAEEARSRGFEIATVGAGGLQALVDKLHPPLNLLRLGGEERVELQLPPGISIEDRAVYRARPCPLSAPAADALREGAVAVLHSGAAGRHFAGECQRLAIDRKAISIAALAPPVANAAGTGWKSVEVAQAVSDAALLALAADMCQNPGRGAPRAKIET